MAGEMVHFEMIAKDADAAQAFWSGLFGWEFGAPMPEMDYRMARIDDASGAAISGGGEGKSHPNVYLATDDIDASLAKVRELGGEAEDKMPVPSMGWFAACKDDQGMEFHLWQVDPAAG
jgi:predicted enzyme related to lactoylglutathione lyase